MISLVEELCFHGVLPYLRRLMVQYLSNRTVLYQARDGHRIAQNTSAGRQHRLLTDKRWATTGVRNATQLEWEDVAFFCKDVISQSGNAKTQLTRTRSVATTGKKVEAVRYSHNSTVGPASGGRGFPARIARLCTSGGISQTCVRSNKSWGRRGRRSGSANNTRPRGLAAGF